MIDSSNPYATPSAESMMPSLPLAGELATRGERFAGAFIDGIIVGPIAFLAGMGLGIGLVLAGVSPETAAFQWIASILGTVLGIVIFLAINGYLLATRGQTVGKLIIKTRIVSEQGTLVPFAPLVLKRYLPLWILASLPMIGGFLVLINSLAIFRESRKCIHDDLAGTKVIKVR